MNMKKLVKEMNNFILISENNITSNDQSTFSKDIFVKYSKEMSNLKHFVDEGLPISKSLYANINQIISDSKSSLKTIIFMNDSDMDEIKYITSDIKELNDKIVQKELNEYESNNIRNNIKPTNRDILSEDKESLDDNNIDDDYSSNSITNLNDAINGFMEEDN